MNVSIFADVAILNYYVAIAIATVWYRLKYPVDGIKYFTNKNTLGSLTIL